MQPSEKQAPTAGRPCAATCTCAQPTATTGPTPAERARTLVESASSAVLEVPGLDLTARPTPWSPLVRTVLPDGSLLMLLPRSSPVVRCVELAHAQSQELRAVVEATDVAPIAVRHRIRGRAWAGGWLTPVPQADQDRYRRLLASRAPDTDEPPSGRLVLLEVADLLTNDLWGTAHVAVDAFARATPDPIAPHELTLLQHLVAAHPDQLERLTRPFARRLAELHEDDAGAGQAAAGATVVPLALDRFGLRVRFTVGRRIADARFDFAQPLQGPEQLRPAMHRLFHHAALDAG
ncbi:DUF2470 domain-containing protein [Kitasatospora kifunensis]|uniref:DUF2470 domain-containing protein n=1 Tax=Kitasatospora kifunensis TaxID=58351 RepID=A0A7W7VSH5_KITKI|nr:DUF2470 domain-containing protein [Kitasatospora kifunensis]MBB4921147.1 hypothetical protein [Kitasatospora kifunensis]